MGILPIAFFLYFSMRIWSVIVLWALLLLAGCGGSSSSNNSNGGSGPVNAVPQVQHVAIVVLENASYHDVIGSASMPYFNQLASQWSSLASYYATAHPSIPNYFMLTAGNTVTFDDGFSGTVSDDNLVRETLASGLTWKAYEESLPTQGYVGGNRGLYIERHDPLSYFSDVRNSTTQSANIVPFAELSADMSSGNLPNLIWITPNAVDNAHSCPTSNPACTLQQRLANADAWLKANVAPLLADSNFSQSGLLIVLFDEGEDIDLDHGGGHVAAVYAGTHVRQGYSSTATYSHQDTLSLIGKALRLQQIPGLGASGGSMTEFFQ
ncbi:MAG TPA: alkaline phosphatase family protein [Candidatus Koribacter sp.]